MRHLTLIIFAFLLLVPASAFAVDISECDASTSMCECAGPGGNTVLDFDLSTGEAIYSVSAPSSSEDDCQSYCLGNLLRYAQLSTWSLTCEVDGSPESVSQGSLSSAAGTAIAETVYADPALSVPIPGLEFTPAYQDGNVVVTNYLGEYIEAIYRWSVGAGALLAIVMIMIGGLQYMLARGNTAGLGAAKKRIGDAVLGLALLLFAWNIANLVDPSTIFFDNLSIGTVEQRLFEDTSGLEGFSGGAVAENCIQAYQNAQENGNCIMSETIGSPIDPSNQQSFSCNYHFATKNYDYTQIKAVDYPADWGQAIYAPFGGTVSYSIGSGSNPCGNHIKLIGNGGNISICHAKDFTDEDGNPITNGTTVEKGDVIGHVGGRCCAGEVAPSDWSQRDQCNVAGTPCNSPGVSEECDCQPYEQSGNTSGPHVHITLFAGGDSILACHDAPPGY